MGVQGLWQLINSVGRPVTLESLENKILAVDVSIWLHQAVQGCRNPTGAPAQNAHLLTLFNRICKLLFYKIKPVFVFDGGIPLLKKQTVAARRQRKELARKESNKTLQKLLQNVMKREAIKQKLNSGSQQDFEDQTVNDIMAIVESNSQPDLFQLADIPKERQTQLQDQDSSSEDSAQDIFQHYLHSRFQDIDSVDIYSESFKSLPLDIQHEILSELKESRKRNSWTQMDEMPKESHNFSSFQMARLVKKRSLQQKLEEIEKQMKGVEVDYFSGGNGDIVVTSSRILSEEGTHYILTKTSPKKPSKTVTATSTQQEKPEKVEERGEARTQRQSSIDFDDIVSSSSNDSVEILQRVVETHSKTSNNKRDEPSIHLTSLRDKMPDFEFIIPSPEPLPVLRKTSSQENTETLINLSQAETIKKNDENEIIIELNKSEFVVDVKNESSNTSTAENFAQPIASTSMIPIPDEDKQKTNDCIESIASTSFNFVQPIASTSVIPTSDEDEKKANGCIQSIASTSFNINPSATVQDDDSSEDSDFIEVPSVVDVDSDSSVHKLDTTTDEQIHMDDDEVMIDQESLTEVNEVEKMIDQESSTEINEVQKLSMEELQELEKDLAKEGANLQKDLAKSDQAAKTLTDQTYAECQELLQLFGVPYVISPMEAEAQCAKLDLLELTHGTITDDSDVWLFGGERVYRNFFNQTKFVEFFKASDIKEHFNLDRLKLICLALMTGSDYTDGIEGVGCVTAMEILSEFPEEGLECLKAFKKWWEENKNIKPAADKPVKRKLRKLSVPPGFPNESIANAYLEPTVDDSKEKFSWSMPDLAALRDYTQFRFGWSRTKSDSLLLPVLKKLNSHETQTRLDSFFKVTLKKESPPLTSKRLKRALRKVANKETPEKKEELKQKAVNILKRKMANAVQAPGKASTTRASRKRKAKPKEMMSKKPTKLPMILDLSEHSSDSSD